MALDFKATNEEVELIDRVAARAQRLLAHQPMVDTMMDLTVANNVCPMDFEQLLAFDDFDFTHDVLGIARHLNRKTGRLEHLFEPRCAK